MYTDFIAPTLSIVSAEMSGQFLNLALDVAAETYMAEILIDGIKWEHVVVNDYADIQIDMTGADEPNHNLGSFTGSVMWDSTHLIYVGDSGIGAGFTGNTNLTDTDRLVFNGANPAGVTGIIDVTTLEFTVEDTG